MRADPFQRLRASSTVRAPSGGWVATGQQMEPQGARPRACRREAAAPGHRPPRAKVGAPRPRVAATWALPRAPPRAPPEGGIEGKEASPGVDRELLIGQDADRDGVLNVLLPGVARHSVLTLLRINVLMTRDSMTARVKNVIEEMADLSPAERAERLRALRAVNDQALRVCRGVDLVHLFESITTDPEFADDIEAGVRERPAMAASRVSPWER